jgi:hypothetical protein
MQDPTNKPPKQEDGRITLARKVLAESQASMSGTDPGYNAARWHGRLEGTVGMLLEIFDEQAAR